MVDTKASGSNGGTVPAPGADGSRGPVRGGSGLFNLYRTLGTGEAPVAGAVPAAAPSRAARLLQAAPAEASASEAAIETPSEAPAAAEAAAEAPELPVRAARAVRRAAAKRAPRSEDGADVSSRLSAARERRQFKRRVRGEDYEQVTVILDRALYLELDRRLADLFESGDGVKLSRSMFVRALLKSFLAQEAKITLDGLFTPDPRNPEELAVIEAALVERLAVS
ncbi:MAG: hypothetical protein HS116_28710 [Planctomycetes bacterium]|nr:hypothetical protein [Planctomycetota bacterium]